MDKLKIKIDKRLLIFLVIIMVIGIISGSILVSIINSNDKTLLHEYLNNFFSNLNNINYTQALFSNLTYTLIYIVGIWLLGISIIGLPIILIMYFSKCFILGFSIGSIIYTFGFKGVLFSLIYSFPGQIIILICLTILMIYSISFSSKLFEALFKHKLINFKQMMNKYLVIFIIILLISILMVLYDTYLMPKLVGLLFK